MIHQMMSTTETYNLLSAVVSFRESYKRLQRLYAESDEADLREMYPLGHIDLFDVNTKNAMVAWLNCHTTKLINALPDRVINPACVHCLAAKKCKCSITASGACSLNEACDRYPYVTYDRNMVVNFLNKQGFEPIEVPKEADDTAVRTIYHNLLVQLNIQEDVK